jgi:hypothetical protein
LEKSRPGGRPPWGMTGPHAPAHRAARCCIAAPSSFHGRCGAPGTPVRPMPFCNSSTIIIESQERLIFPNSPAN